MLLYDRNQYTIVKHYPPIKNKFRKWIIKKIEVIKLKPYEIEFLKQG